jgi:hypothetical protein
MMQGVEVVATPMIVTWTVASSRLPGRPTSAAATSTAAVIDGTGRSMTRARE